MAEIRDDYTLNNSSPISANKNQSIENGILSANNSKKKSDTEKELSDDISVSKNTDTTIDCAEKFYTGQQSDVKNLQVKNQNLAALKEEAVNIQSIVRAAQMGSITEAEAKEKIRAVLNKIDKLSSEIGLTNEDSSQIGISDDLNSIMAKIDSIYSKASSESDAATNKIQSIVNEVSSSIEAKIKSNTEDDDNTQAQAAETTSKIKKHAKDNPQDTIKMHVFNLDTNLILSLLSL